MILFKEGTHATNVSPAIWAALGICYAIRQYIHPSDLVVTSMNDGSHGTHSLHYPQYSPDTMCRAVDMRVHDMPKEFWFTWAAKCQSILNPLGYDIVLHDGTDGVAAHLHVEYQPKAGESDWIARKPVIIST